MNIKNAQMLFTLIVFEAKRYKAFPTEIIAILVGKVIEVGLYITFWVLVSKYSATADITPQVIVSYYLIVSGIAAIFSTELGISSQLIKMVRFGELNQVLIRPIHPFLVPWSRRVGRTMLAMILAAIQIAIGVIISDGLHGTAWLLLPFALFNAFAINIAFNMIVGTISFYFTEASGIKNTFSHIYRLCGGQLVPLFLMPASVATALQFTPFPAGQYQLAALLQGTYPVQPFFIGVGVAWAVGLLFFARYFWNRSLSRYEAVGS